MQSLKITYRLLVLLTIGLAFNACIEPFEIENVVFESALVVEATITDEEKQQTITLSRAYSLGEEGPRPESNAFVLVVENDHTQYTFNENELGRYVSAQNFAAKAGASYVLSITTADGRKYTSTPETTPEKVPISNVYAERETNDLGEEGVSILLDNEAPPGEPRYFRYEYEETYKIVAPNWTPFEYDIIDDVLFTDGDGFEVGLKPEEEPRQVCYNTVTSVNPIQTSTASLSENTISRFSIRFLGRKNYIISHRYSILVRQYTQTPEAFFYYQKLNDFSSSESVFTDLQAGFLEGNIKSTSNFIEKVVGYFEVTAVDSERMYFNYADLFPDEFLPPYEIDCSLTRNFGLYETGLYLYLNQDGEIEVSGATSSPLIDAIRSGLIKFYSVNETYSEQTDIVIDPTGSNLDLTTIQYFSKTTRCIDCRELGSNVKPDFWKEQ